LYEEVLWCDWKEKGAMDSGAIELMEANLAFEEVKCHWLRSKSIAVGA
jgi:hypothetical protein